MNEHLVRLVGGPLDGEYRLLDAARKLFTELIEEDSVDLASYRKHDGETFVYCRTQTALGDTGGKWLGEDE